MTTQHPKSGLWSYIRECLRLLYWSYFKPYTFANWLQEIHPQLYTYTNPFTMRVEFRSNPRLRRYAGQVWWLTFVTPILIVLLVALVYTLVSGKSFNWFYSGLFWLGWLIGLIVTMARGDNKRLQRWFYWFIWVATGVLLVWNASLLFARETMQSLLQHLDFLPNLLPTLAQFWSLGLGVALGVIFGVGLAVAFGVTFSVAGIVTGGVAGGVAESVMIGVAFGVALGMVLGVPRVLVRRVVVGLLLGVPGIVAGGKWGIVAGGLALILGVLRVYFWLPELLWVFILRFFTLQQNPAPLLRYLPPRFDQLIYLPLPFMAEMIVRAYQKNPAIARETINYLTTSTNQQQVAATAMVDIAINRLNSCQALSDIANITEELAWIPSPPPKQLGSLLPQLLDISQDVQAAVSASSVSRKYELLAPAITALQNLGNSLAFSRNPGVATTFGSIIKSWLGILETAQRHFAEQEQYSTEIPQVYIAGNALDPKTAKNRFKGRVDLFREIETFALAESPPVLLLYGGRRTGKTSSLKYLPYKVGANLIPLLVDLQGAASATTLPGLADNLVSQILEASRRLPRKIDLPYPDSETTDPFIALQNWLGQIERKFPGKRFLLCLDEYERLSEVVETTNSKVPLNFLRNILQHRTAWTLLFSGAHQLSELPDYWSDYLINTRALRMSYLQELEARELIVEPVEGFRQIYEPEAVDEIIRLTHCQPYLVQLMCYEVVELLNRETRANRRDADTVRATAQDVENVIPIVLERGDQYFRELWRSLTDSDRNLLWRVSENEAPTSADSRIVRKLVQKEILLQESDRCYFQVPLIKKYLEYLYLTGEEI